jgi:membrane protein implicated in regulation of membrane protease activity
MRTYSGFSALVAFILFIALLIAVLSFVLGVTLLLVPAILIAGIVAWLLSPFWKKRKREPVVEVRVKKF